MAGTVVAGSTNWIQAARRSLCCTAEASARTRKAAVSITGVLNTLTILTTRRCNGEQTDVVTSSVVRGRAAPTFRQRRAQGPRKRGTRVRRVSVRQGVANTQTGTGYPNYYTTAQNQKTNTIDFDRERDSYYYNYQKKYYQSATRGTINLVYTRLGIFPPCTSD